jgi:hypothetical protein
MIAALIILAVFAAIALAYFCIYKLFDTDNGWWAVYPLAFVGLVVLAALFFGFWPLLNTALGG